MFAVAVLTATMLWTLPRLSPSSLCAVTKLNPMGPDSWRVKISVSPRVFWLLNYFSRMGTRHTPPPKLYDLHVAPVWRRTCFISFKHIHGTPSKGTVGLSPPLFTVMVFQWEPGPKLILIIISARPLSFPFLLLTAIQDKMMRLGTHWALLVCRQQNPSHEGTARGKDWEFSKFSSNKSSNLSHSVLQLHESLLPPVLLYCMLILWLSWETHLYWTSTEQKLGHLLFSLQSIASLPLSLDLMEFLGNCFLAVAFF